MVVRVRPAARWTDVRKSGELHAGLFAVEQYDRRVTKRMQITDQRSWTDR